MAKKRTATLIVDKKESLPLRVNHTTRKWEIFDPATNSYEDTGIPAVPEDDATAVKYYKLSNAPVAPTAPGDSQTSWADVASLNTAVITQGEWSADPLQVSLTNRFCWAAYYRLENVKNAETGVYSQKYKLNLVGLYNNYAASPTIAIDENGKVTITNADGTTQTHQLMTAASYNSLMTMVTALQSQVDSAVYSYSGVGVPTKDHAKAPLNSWGIKTNSPSNVIADIYNTHVGDTYTNTEDYVSYRFVLKEGQSASDPLSYEWQVIADGALSAALQEIAKLGNSSVKIFTAQPTPPYKRGDMWIETVSGKQVIKTCVIPKDENGAFAATDWIVPFATKEEVEVIRQDLQQAKSDLATAQGNLTDLQSAMNTLENETLTAMKDNIISENERKSLQTFSDQLDVEQEQLLSNVAYLKASEYLPGAQKTTLENAANKLLTATTGTLDVLQAKIAAILNPSGDQGAIISTTERTAYQNALATYKVDHKSLAIAIDNARAAVDSELKRLADEKIDNLEVGGRNYLMRLTDGEQSDAYRKISIENGVVNWEQLGPGTSPLRFNHSEILENNKYTFSFKCDNVEKLRIWITAYNENDTIVKCLPEKSNIAQENENTWYVQAIFNVPKLSRNYNFFYGTAPFEPSKSVKFWNFKLEKGNKATDYTPAPEDVAADIATSKSEAETAAKAYADAQDNAKQVEAQAYADNKITEEEQRAIADANAKLAAAKAYAEAKDAELKTQQEAYADGRISASEAASIAAAKAYADLKKTEAQAYADNKITEEEQRAIADAQAKYDAARAYADAARDSLSPSLRYWYLRNSQNIIESIPDAKEGSEVLRMSGSNSFPNAGVFIPLDAEKEYKVHFWARASANCDGYLYFALEQHKEDKTPCNINGGKKTYKPVRRTAHSEWKLYEYIWKTGDWDEDVKYVLPIFLGNYQGTKGFWEINGFKFFEVTDIEEAKNIRAPEISTTTGNWMLWDSTQKKLVDSGRSASGDDGNPPKIVDGIWWEWDAAAKEYKKTGIKAHGEDALAISLQIQGHFRNYWERQVDANGAESYVLKKEVVGGVDVNGTEYVQATAVIRKGVRDVTDVAIANGAALEWRINGVKKFGNVKTVHLGVEYADGNDDQIFLDYDDTNAANW